MQEADFFNSKILLFGEYSIIQNSMALSVAYPLFNGSLEFRTNKTQGRDTELRSFSASLKKLKYNDIGLKDFDINSFEFDIGQGLFFNSTIPQGYGVGSSGALCAAIYSRYGAKNTDTNLGIYELKNLFSKMESHFHGASSGLDPLISYLNTNILITEKNDIKKIKIGEFKKGPGAIFLLNTGRSRKTEPLVNLFLEKCKTSEFNKLCKNFLLPITNKCITDFLAQDMDSLYQNFEELSEFQLENFTPMIPKLYRDVWAGGLSSKDYFFKLCGAGGGGFLIGMTKDFSKVTEVLSSHEIRPLYSF